MKKVRESPDSAYISGMATKLSNLGKSCIWKLTIAGSMDTTKFDGIMEDPDFKKIMAAIDMFLTKFEDHELGFLHAGALISRYKQCMGILDLFYADSAFYLPRGEILQWVFLDPIADQIVRMYETEDEIGNVFSYMPYCVDLDGEWCNSQLDTYPGIFPFTYHIWAVFNLAFILCYYLLKRKNYF